MKSARLAAQCSLIDRLRGGVFAGDITLGCASAQAMLIESARGLACTIKPGDDLAIQIQHLALAIDSKTRAAIVHERRAPSGVEWRRLDLVLGRRLAEIQIRAAVHKRIVALHRCLQGNTVHWLRLIWMLNRGRKLLKRPRAEEIAVGIYVGRSKLP